jgi:hypothetical protein
MQPQSTVCWFRTLVVPVFVGKYTVLIAEVIRPPTREQAGIKDLQILVMRALAAVKAV